MVGSTFGFTVFYIKLPILLGLFPLFDDPSASFFRVFLSWQLYSMDSSDMFWSTLTFFGFVICILLAHILHSCLFLKTMNHVALPFPHLCNRRRLWRSTALAADTRAITSLMASWQCHGRDGPQVGREVALDSYICLLMFVQYLRLKLPSAR